MQRTIVHNCSGRRSCSSTGMAAVVIAISHKHTFRVKEKDHSIAEQFLLIILSKRALNVNFVGTQIFKTAKKGVNIGQDGLAEWGEWLTSIDDEIIPNMGIPNDQCQDDRQLRKRQEKNHFQKLSIRYSGASSGGVARKNCVYRGWGGAMGILIFDSLRFSRIEHISSSRKFVRLILSRICTTSARPVWDFGYTCI